MRDLVVERRKQLAPSDPKEQKEFLAMEDPRSTLAGLALSGGGIRSATFALGVLQALGERGLLTAFDYLSTVSGGGFVGGWWSAWLSRPDRKPGETFPEDERLEPDRFPAVLLDEHNVPSAPPNNLPKDTPSGSRSAWLKDPIHHLRLFSNYLTPRKGALSGDTWRAITVVSRNLLLTWAVLVPVLLAVVLVAQLYFAGHPSHGPSFVCSRPVSGLAASQPDPSAACAEFPARGHGEAVRERVRVMVEPFVAVGIVVGTLILLWLLYGGGNPLVALLGFAAVAGGVILLFRDADSGEGTLWPRLAAVLWTERSGWIRTGEIGAALTLVIGGLGPLATTGLENLRRRLRTKGPLRPDKRAPVPADRIRNLIVRWHARILAGATVAFLVLLVAGFGHELVWFLFTPESGAAFAAVRKAGGWTAVVLTVVSGFLAALRAGPTKKGKDAAAETPRLPTKVLLAIAPPLVLAALAVAAAAVGHRLYEIRAPASVVSFGNRPEVLAALVGIAILAMLTLYERWSSGSDGRDYPIEPQWCRMAIVGGSLVVLGAIVLLGPARVPGPALWSPLGFAALFGLALLVFFYRLATTRTEGSWASIITRKYARGAERQADQRVLREVDEFLAKTPDPRERMLAETERHKLLGHPRAKALSLLASLFVAGAIVAVSLYPMLPSQSSPDARAVGGWLTASFLFGVGFLLLDLVLSRRDSDRSTWLAGLVTLASAVLVALLHQTITPFVVFGTSLVIFLIAAVVGLGWTTDPNLIALHNFYKARLVRAFLGASNPARKHIDITETAATDDLLLKDLKNHMRGAPIQIINTTLNLVGGKDLATAQRLAAPFMLSSEICGSARTGYHRTDQYMGGTLKLGTAIATSGAAVSTNMGSRTMSSALGLLLAFFNVRLGIWAPTPNRERWYESKPRLWPFYLLREGLSQTNDLGPYCYLTDGGHFDNTGLYALVERGCRYIMVLDSGADPQPCFADMGEAVRRCRIDFGAEIEYGVAVEKFLEAADGKLAQIHYARGQIRYAEPHLRMLGWDDNEIEQCNTGIIVWIKPTVTPKDSVDVRQYKLENEKFPHQTTADQWYDESQFESYRSLGYQSVAAALAGVSVKAKAKDLLNAF